VAAEKLLLHVLNAACLEYQKPGEDRRRKGARGDKRGSVQGGRGVPVKLSLLID